MIAKLKTIARTLLEVPDHGKDKVVHLAKNYLYNLFLILERLEHMSFASKTAAIGDDEEWFRLWVQVHEYCASFFKHQDFLQKTGVLVLSGCEELIKSNSGQGDVG